jgi:hypothetical protein
MSGSGRHKKYESHHLRQSGRRSNLGVNACAGWMEEAQILIVQRGLTFRTRIADLSMFRGRD